MNKTTLFTGAAAAALALLRPSFAAAQQAAPSPSAPVLSGSSVPGPFISISKSGTIHTVVVRGEADLYNSYKIKEIVLKMIDTGVRDIVIDLAECSYIDSSGLGSLIYCQSSMRKAGGTLKLARVHGQVLTVMTLTKLADYFTLVDTAPLPEGALDIDIDIDGE